MKLRRMRNDGPGDPRKAGTALAADWGNRVKQGHVIGRMLSDSFSDEQIVKYTQCTPELLEKVKKSMA